MHSQSIEPARSTRAEPLQSASRPYSAIGVEAPAVGSVGCGITVLMPLLSCERRERYTESAGVCAYGHAVPTPAGIAAAGDAATLAASPAAFFRARHVEHMQGL